MNDPSPAIAVEARPRLPRGVRLVHNEAQGGWVLLAPERVFKADQIAVEIIKRCTGEATFGEIVDDLANTYAAPREKILADASTLLRGSGRQTAAGIVISCGEFALASAMAAPYLEMRSGQRGRPPTSLSGMARTVGAARRQA